MTWRPSLALFKTGFAQVSLGVASNLKTLDVSWRFSTIVTSPIQVVRCDMSIGEISAYGVGHGFFAFGAMTRGFCEAWERVILALVKKRVISSAIVPSSSNGMAAGSSALTARKSAILEYVERAVLLQAWSEVKGWREIRTSKFSGFPYLAILRSLGWSVRISELGNDTPYRVRVGVAQHEKYGCVIDSAAADGSLQENLTRKVLSSLCRGSLIAAAIKDSNENFLLPTVGDPMDHIRFYRIQENRAAFEFVQKENCAELSVSLGNLNQLQVIDLVAPGIMPAVACAYHPKWIPLSWGRSSIGGKNPWPHPLG